MTPTVQHTYLICPLPDCGEILFTYYINDNNADSAVMVHNLSNQSLLIGNLSALAVTGKANTNVTPAPRNRTLDFTPNKRAMVSKEDGRIIWNTLIEGGWTVNRIKQGTP
jgi:hypothetical protein